MFTIQGQPRANGMHRVYDEDVPIDLCGMSVISIGKNMPCLDTATQVAYDERSVTHLDTWVHKLSL